MFHGGGGAIAGLVASIGMALVITSLVGPGKQTPQVVDSTASGLAHLEEASLGYKV